MPIGIGILSDLLLVAASREVLVYKLQSVLWSLFLLSPGLVSLLINREARTGSYKGLS